MQEAKHGTLLLPGDLGVMGLRPGVQLADAHAGAQEETNCPEDSERNIGPGCHFGRARMAPPRNARTDIRIGNNRREAEPDKRKRRNRDANRLEHDKHPDQRASSDRI
jgi:hypothetical protein